MEAFEKSALTSVIFCAALMSAVDGSVDKEEWEVIKRFIKEHWTPDFGDFRVVREKISNNVKTLIKNRVAMNNKLNQLVAILKRKLSQQQKETMLALVKDVMMADDTISPKEKKLLDQLEKIMKSS